MDKHLEVQCDIDLHLMVIKSKSIYREMTKNPIYKITGNFSENAFKIPVQPPIFRNSKDYLFFLITRS